VAFYCGFLLFFFIINIIKHVLYSLSVQVTIFQHNLVRIFFLNNIRFSPFQWTYDPSVVDLAAKDTSPPQQTMEQS
jgi:hypothetical protein